MLRHCFKPALTLNSGPVVEHPIFVILAYCHLRRELAIFCFNLGITIRFALEFQVAGSQVLLFHFKPELFGLGILIVMLQSLNIKGHRLVYFSVQLVWEAPQSLAEVKNQIFLVL